MSKILLSRFDKHEIPQLPQVSFGGRIIVIQTEQEAEKAVDYLLTSSILGFDTETRPSFTRGRQHKVALLQVSNHDTCFLFRLNLIGITDAILRLLTDQTVKKVGLSWHDDINSLHRRQDFECAPFVELQDFVKEFGILDLSLQKLYANVFRQRISKTQQLSNWEADVYTDAQKLYAATDAWACVMLYEELTRLKETGDYTLEVIPEPEPVIKPKEEATEEKKSKSQSKNPREPKKKDKTDKRRKYYHKRKPKANVQESISQEG